MSDPDPLPPPFPAAVSPDGVALVQHFEGLSLRAYRCPAGVLTIGWGHTGPDVSPGETVTEARAGLLLAQDLAHAAAAVRRRVTVPLSQPQFDALASFTFNVGEGALAGSTLLRRLNAGDYPGVAPELARWTRAAGRILPGLVARRTAEVMLWASGGPPAMPHRVDAPDPAP